MPHTHGAHLPQAELRRDAEGVGGTSLEGPLHLEEALTTATQLPLDIDGNVRRRASSLSPSRHYRHLVLVCAVHPTQRNHTHTLPVERIKMAADKSYHDVDEEDDDHQDDDDRIGAKNERLMKMQAKI